MITPVRYAATRSRVSNLITPQSLRAINRAARFVRKQKGAVKTISRAWKAYTYRKSKFQKRTEPSVKETTRQHGSIPSNRNLLNIATLYFNVIEFPAQGAVVGSRKGENLFLSGIKICESFINTGSIVPNIPLEMHYAIIQLGCPNDDPLAFIKEKFFRQTVGDKRYQAFNDATVGSDWSFAKNCLALNPDQFRVLCHWKKVLRQNGDTSNGFGTYMWKIDRYLKIKKWVAFDDADDQTPNKPIICVYWYNSVSGTDWETIDNVADYPAVEHSSRNTVYFRDKA